MSSIYLDNIFTGVLVFSVQRYHQFCRNGVDKLWYSRLRVTIACDKSRVVGESSAKLPSRFLCFSLSISLFMNGESIDD
jgi:hypothetical protein